MQDEVWPAAIGRPAQLARRGPVLKDVSVQRAAHASRAVKPFVAISVEAAVHSWPALSQDAE
jgi:hypothetical protein